MWLSRMPTIFKNVKLYILSILYILDFYSTFRYNPRIPLAIRIALNCLISLYRKFLQWNIPLPPFCRWISHWGKLGTTVDAWHKRCNNVKTFKIQRLVCQKWFRYLKKVPSIFDLGVLEKLVSFPYKKLFFRSKSV